MSTVVVGFDSAWTQAKRGALAAAVVDPKAPPRALGGSVAVSFDEASDLIEGWRPEANRMLVMIDQPTIVPNERGCRQVEKVVCSTISRARGGVQPANRGRDEMFGLNAPLWPFLTRLVGSLDPAEAAPLQVIETYPALALLGLGWVRSDQTLLKYNPERRRTYRASDWESLCHLLAGVLADRGLIEFAMWCEEARNRSERPGKARQDSLDALICLLGGLLWVDGRPTLQVGSTSCGLMVVPDHCGLRERLLPRLAHLGWEEGSWLAWLDTIHVTADGRVPT